MNALIDNEFDLDLQVTTDAWPDSAAPCTTNDGCQPTCQSACTSNS